jgi:peptide/nickel transport system substrate-binding protein
MGRITSRWIAAASAIALIGSLGAARRPRYGGNLRVQIGASVQSLDPGEWPNDPAEAAAKAALAGVVFETLVRLDPHGQPQPALAIFWSHDAARKRWIFKPRPNVVLHDGSPWEPPESALSFSDDRPIERILSDLARPRNAVAVRLSDGTLTGTGPFALARWDPGKSATLTAHAGYWGGRAYLDSIDVQMGRTDRQQALDFEAGKADVIEAGIADLRRLRERNANLSVSAPVEVVAIVFEGARAVPPQVQQALALSIDRAAIQSVLLQRQGEISAALLPQWLSGYSFVFSTARDLARARQLAAGAAPLTLTYDRADMLARSIAERIAVNASEAGLPLRSVPGAAADARLVRFRITSFDPFIALEDLAAQLKSPMPAASDIYGSERALLRGSRVIPLLHLPLARQISPKVHGWNENGRLEDVWLEGGPEP